MTDTLSVDSYLAARDGTGSLPIDAEVMFSDDAGTHKPRVEKRQRKLLERVGALKNLLEDDEKVLTITQAVSPTSFLEQWTTGFIFVYLKRCLLVFTDRRILHVPTTMSYDYRGSVAQIRYGDIESIAQKGSRLKIAYKGGSKEQFLYLRRSERKKIRKLLEAANLAAQPSKAGKRVHICPQCATELEAGRYDCPGCGKAFKSRSRARTLSILVPGGGYFYTGHPFLGITDAAIEVFLLALIVMTLLTPITDAPFSAQIAIAVVFTIGLVIEKAITVYHANHFVAEYLPVERVRAPRRPLRTALSALGAVIIVGFFALGIVGTLMDVGQAPSDRVLAAEQVTTSDYEVLRAEGIIEEGETIELFYSEGVFSVKEGGSILTDFRVIAYQEGDDGAIQSYYIPNDEIVSVTLLQQGDTLNYSIYEVSAAEEGTWIQLWLPHEHGDGERFANAVRAKIR